MAWPEAAAALAAALAAADGVDEVLRSPPVTAAAVSDGTTVWLTPPARAAARSPGRLETTVTADLTVTAPMGNDPVHATALVEAAVEGITAALEGTVTLGGAATSTEPPTWQAAVAAEYPPGSGVFHIAMRATMPVTLVTSPARGA